MYAKTPTVFQMEMTECGAASLCMILSFYGCHVPLEKMRVESGVSRDGCSLKGVKRAAQVFGLQAHGYRRDTKALEHTQVPCIIHWNGNHFVVLEGFKGKFAYINDPALGRRRLTRESLEAGYSGIVMTFDLTDRFQKTEKKAGDSPVHSRLIAGRGALLGIFLTGVLAALCCMAAPVALGSCVDGMLLAGRENLLPALAGLLFICLLIRAALGFCREQMIETLKARMTLYSSRDFLRHLFRLPVSFFDQRYTGDLVSRVIASEQVCRFLSRDLPSGIVHLFSLCAYLIMMILSSPVLTLISLGRAAVCLYTAAAGQDSDASIRLQMSRGKINGAVIAGLNITDSIKACGMEGEYAARIMGDQAECAEYEQTLARRRSAVGAIQEAARYLTVMILLLLGGSLVIAGRITPGTLAAFCLMHEFFSASADEITRFFIRLRQTLSGVKRIEDIDRHEICPLLKPRANRAAAPRLQGHIELRDITFGYSKIQPPLIDMFDLSIASGESVAIVGSSGCGKSTIAGVVSGLYSPWKGEVLFDGVPMQEISSEIIRNSISTVSQEIHLFSGSILDNLTMWDPTILQEDVEAAARDACIEDFILSCPGGYAYPLKEHALNISGGERQRLEIARALAKNPSVLLLDEATSALDPLVEKQIMDNIRRRGCTCIIAAHRLSAIRDCSRIVVMDGGTIAEEGTHDSLIRSNGLYAALMRAD